MSYVRFAAMVATSTILMFGLMYLNVFSLSHIEFSQTRTWMALIMGAVMAITMLGFMWGMYKNRGANFAILLGSLIVFVGSLWLVRSQETVGDVSYMRAMIPHHSIAILTSERAHIRDPEVRILADRIIDAQVREIAEMKRLIARLEQQPVRSYAPDLPSYRERGDPPPLPETESTLSSNGTQFRVSWSLRAWNQCSSVLEALWSQGRRPEQLTARFDESWNSRRMEAA